MPKNIELIGHIALFCCFMNSIVKRIGIIIPKTLQYLARNKQKRISKTWLFIIMC